jgi:hypothetical protein
MDDWGFNGPIIEGIKAVHYTYGFANIFFESVAEKDQAQKLTGWEEWDSDALQMPLHYDMVRAISPELGVCYFGDWEFQTQTPQGDSV